MKTFVAFCLGGLCAAALIWGTARAREQKCRQRAVAAQAKAAVAEKKEAVLTVRPGDYPEPPDLTPWVTGPGTLQLKSGHVQGACVSKDAVYMTLHNGIYKYDWQGNLLKKIPAEIHQGDICYSKGRLYVSVAVKIKKAGEPEGRIDVYDANLNFVTNTVFEKPADGITCMNGVLYVGLGPSRIKERPYCGSWYGTFDEKTLKPIMKPRLVEHGYPVSAGVQNICNDGEKLYVQVYTPEMEDPCFLIFDRDFNLLGSDVFGWRNGLDIVNWKGRPCFIYFSTVSNGKCYPPIMALMRYAELKPNGKVVDISNWCHFSSPSGRYKELYAKDTPPARRVRSLAVKPGDYPEPLDLEPWVTRSGTLQHNCGHVQGACVSKDAVYMTLHNGIYKYDWRGNLLKSVPAQVHQGDICHSKGKLYVSVAVQIKKAGEPEGRIDVYDENLNFLTNAVFAKPADGITCMNGVLYVGLGPARVKDDPYCGSWYGTFDEKTLRPLMKPRLVRHGSEVCAGVQNICNDGEKLYVQVYTPEMGTPCFLIFDKDFNLLGSDVFGWRNGLDIVNWKGKPYFIYFSTLSNGKHFPPVQALMRYAELNPYGKLTDISDWCYFISPSGRYRELYRKPKDRRSEGRHMTFMEYNIFQCWGWDKPIDHRSLAPGDLGKLPQIAEIIRGQNPDWIVLCEAARGYKHSGFVDQPAEFAKRCGLKATYFSGGGLTNRWGNAILSKESPLSARVVKHYDGKNPCSVIVAEFRDYFVLATHFPLKDPDQMKSAGIVLAEARKLTGAKPVFLAGDLNATPESRPIARLKEAFTVLSSQEAMTWPSHAPRMCIDYIMVDTGHAGAFKVKAAQALPETTAADHRPVVVEAEWKRK